MALFFFNALPSLPQTLPSLPPRLASLEDSLKTALKKLADTERDNTKRIADLEGKLTDKVQKHVDGAIEKNINSIKESVKESVIDGVQAKVESLSEISAKAGRSWVFPFIILVIVLLAMAGCFFRFAQTTNRKLKLSLD